MMKNNVLFVLLLLTSFSANAGGGTAQFNVVPASHPNACNAIELQNLDSDGTTAMDWTFSPAAINAATGLPVSTLTVDPTTLGVPPVWPVVYWPSSPAYSSLTIGYNGATQDFNTCDCNAFAAGDFFNAPLICNTDHYCGNTAGAYIEDFMQGDTPAGGLGANGDGCLFCGGASDHEGSIENNSWLKFIADDTTVDFVIEVFGSCYIQFAVYAYDPTAPLGSNGVLTLLTPMVWTNVDTGFTGGPHTITAAPLTPGNEYYLHFDGHGGADCDYEIGFSSGIVTFDALASDASVCAGQPVTLNATPADPTATYTWTDNFGNTFANSDEIIVNPTAPTTYTLEVLLPGCSNNPETVDVGIDPCPLPVEFNSFDVVCKQDHSVIEWETASEWNNDYFIVERSSSDFNFVELEKVPGSGTSSQPHSYKVEDFDRISGEAYYRIRQIDVNGKETFSSVISTQSCTESDFVLYDIYYNDITQEIVINFEANRPTELDLSIADLKGVQSLSLNHLVEVNQNQIRVPTSSLESRSMYIVNVSTNYTQDSERLIIE